MKAGLGNRDLLNEFASSNPLSTWCSTKLSAVSTLIDQDEGVAPERIILKTELAALKSRMTSLAKNQSIHPYIPQITDEFLADKLNLAYQDIISIYDLRWVSCTKVIIIA